MLEAAVIIDSNRTLGYSLIDIERPYEMSGVVKILLLHATELLGMMSNNSEHLKTRNQFVPV